MSKNNYNIHLKGFVGGADFDRNYVDYVLSKHNDKPVAVLIDSLGGSVATALSIASAFRNHGDVTAHFVGMNASAATIASLGAKHISIDANAMYLVHKCSTAFFEWGSLNADQFATLIEDCEKIKVDLDKLDLNIASMYASKTKKPASELLDLMKIGGWLSAHDALDWGFVDEVTDYAETAPKLTDAVASEMAAAGMPIPNIPIADKEGAFAKFLASLSSLFKPIYKERIKPEKEIIMSTLFPKICAVLGIDAVKFVDNAPDITLENLTALEMHLSQQQEAVDVLNAQIASLKAAPADNSTSVIENSKPTADIEDKSEVEQYIDTVNTARELYDLV